MQRIFCYSLLDFLAAIFNTKNRLADTAVAREGARGPALTTIEMPPMIKMFQKYLLFFQFQFLLTFFA